MISSLFNAHVGDDEIDPLDLMVQVLHGLGHLGEFHHVLAVDALLRQAGPTVPRPPGLLGELGPQVLVVRRKELARLLQAGLRFMPMRS